MRDYQFLILDRTTIHLNTLIEDSYIDAIQFAQRPEGRHGVLTLYTKTGDLIKIWIERVAIITLLKR